MYLSIISIKQQLLFKMENNQIKHQLDDERLKLNSLIHCQ